MPVYWALLSCIQHLHQGRNTNLIIGSSRGDGFQCYIYAGGECGLNKHLVDIYVVSNVNWVISWQCNWPVSSFSFLRLLQIDESMPEEVVGNMF